MTTMGRGGAGAVRPTVWRGLFLLWAGGVTVLSLTPVQHLPPQVFDVWDKAQHALAFAVLAVLARLAWPQAHTATVALALLAHGAAIEVAQAATGWRHGDVADWIADAVGVALGWVGLAVASGLRATWRATRG